MFNTKAYLDKIRPYLGSLVIIVSLGGLWYPVLGYFMVVVMGTLFITSIFRGRWFCGNLCPRGSYFDYGIIKISKKRKIPKILSSMWLRIPVFTAMITFMMYRISVTFAAQNTFELIGTIFVSVCLMTTIIGTILGARFNTRSWCNFCPMGTMQRIIGGNKYQLQMNHDTCVDCKLCEKACPMQLKVRDIGNNPDCIKCGRCVDKCPKDSLSF
ncbi:4Fe-4S binding protein [Methanococcoides sp. FTZ1]|uniref:4Fe-4S binding protein n=1 Tax=Methanococcoides sp. FTZ1 TaxID=3439061 RepID=UPI003F82A247